MDTLSIITLIAATLLMASIVIYGKYYVKTTNIVREKVNLTLSVVIIVKNNERLLKQTLSTILKTCSDVDEILILDLGSFDNSYKIIQSYMKLDRRIKYISALEKTVSSNCSNLIRDNVSGHKIFIFDLNQIGELNKNIYSPDIFKGLDNAIINTSNIDKRIDGTKLLKFDKLEREKNNFITNEFITQSLCNIRSHLESIYNNPEVNLEKFKNQIKDSELYIENIIKNTNIMLKLIGTEDYHEESLIEYVTLFFNNLSKEYNLDIFMKTIGIERMFNYMINSLAIDIVEDILYTIVRPNLYPSVETIFRYKKDKLQILFKYDCIYKADVLSSSSELESYMLQSIQNRLNLIGGFVKANVSNGKKTSIFVQIPINGTTISTV